MNKGKKTTKILTGAFEKKDSAPTVIIEPNKVNWAKRVAGIAKGIYGDVDKYIEHERASWNKDKPWP